MQYSRHLSARDWNEVADLYRWGARIDDICMLYDIHKRTMRRHLQRLHGAPLSTTTGLTGLNVAPLFDYGASVRRELEQYVKSLDGDEADQIRTFDVREQQWPMTPRKLLFHILLHEIRHWAQVALAVRIAGLEPPGDHDLFFSRAVR